VAEQEAIAYAKGRPGKLVFTQSWHCTIDIGKKTFWKTVGIKAHRTSDVAKTEVTQWLTPKVLERDAIIVALAARAGKRANLEHFANSNTARCDTVDHKTHSFSHDPHAFSFIHCSSRPSSLLS
jgi:hypothetical protein